MDSLNQPIYFYNDPIYIYIYIFIICMIAYYLIILIELQAVLFEYLYDITLMSLIYASNPIYDLLSIPANHL